MDARGSARREWGMFALLGLIWGSSFLWIKIGLGHGFAPLLLVTMRLAVGVLGLGALMLARGERPPSSPRVLASSALVGFFNTALPFALITWGETRIPSGLASILNGTVPLFSIVIAHLVLEDERFTPLGFVGLVLGFVGIVVLVGGGGSSESGATAGKGELAGLGSRWGQFAVLAAACSYAIAASLSRRVLRGLAPLAQSFTTLTFSTLFLGAAVALGERPVRWPTDPLAWVAITWLGLLGSCTAYLLYFSLLNAWGATRSTVVTYVFPVVGLVLGISVLGEPLDWRLVVGTLLVVGGIVVVNGPSLRAAFLADR